MVTAVVWDLLLLELISQAPDIDLVNVFFSIPTTKDYH